VAPKKQDKSALMMRVLQGHVFETGHVEHVFDKVLHEFGGILGFAAKLIETYEEGTTNQKVQSLKLIAGLSESADKSRRAEREYEMIDTKDLMRVAAEAMEANMNRIEGDDDQ